MADMGSSLHSLEGETMQLPYGVGMTEVKKEVLVQSNKLFCVLIRALKRVFL